MTDDPRDPMPEIVAAMDQAIAGMETPARFLKGTFDAFVKEGFNAEQALQLTIEVWRQAQDS